jgi:hypothetical protein
MAWLLPPLGVSECKQETEKLLLKTKDLAIWGQSRLWLAGHTVRRARVFSQG